LRQGQAPRSLQPVIVVRWMNIRGQSSRQFRRAGQVQSAQRAVPKNPVARSPHYLRQFV